MLNTTLSSKTGPACRCQAMLETPSTRAEIDQAHMASVFIVVERIPSQFAMYHLMSMVKDLAARARTDCEVQERQQRCLLVSIRSKFCGRGGFVEVGTEL